MSILVNENIYLFQVDENKIVTNKIVFNETVCGKSVTEWIEESGETWYISKEKVSGQYYPEYGPGFTAEIKPRIKKPHLWEINMEKRLWEPKGNPYPSEPGHTFYRFCEEKLEWVNCVEECC
jgi:hypothetical protein